MLESSESIFSRQFCGQHSYGLEDLAQHIQQLPPCFSSDTHHTSVNKPQAQFVDRIDNSSSSIFEQLFDLHDLRSKDFQMPLVLETLSGSPVILIDDKIKYGSLIDQIEKQSADPGTVVLLSCYSEQKRSYFGFTCWIGIRIMARDGLVDTCYLIDALGLRSYLRGEVLGQKGIAKTLFSNAQIRKIFVDERALLQLTHDFLNPKDGGIKNYVTFLPQNHDSNITFNAGESDPNLLVLQKTIDYRVRSTDPLLIDLLCQMTRQALCLKGSKLNSKQKSDPRKSTFEATINKSSSQLILELNEWREKVARFDDESVEYVMPIGLIMYMDRQIPKDIKSGQQHIQHSQDMLNQCCQWWHDFGQQGSQPGLATCEYNFYIPFYVKIYQQDITDIILNQHAMAKKDHQVENIYENILSSKNLDQKFLDDNFGRMPATQNADEFTLMDNGNFLTLVNILKNASNPQGIMNQKERGHYGEVLRELTSGVQNAAKTDREGENSSFDLADQYCHDAIPVSIAEIYEISNKNRKKNKARKKNNNSCQVVGTGSFVSSRSNNTATGGPQQKISGRTKDQAQQNNNFINYNELVEIMKHQHKLDGKENGMQDFKAVQNMRDSDFVRYLNWPQPSSFSPMKSQQATNSNRHSDFKFNTSNTYQSPSVGQKASQQYNPRQQFVSQKQQQAARTPNAQIQYAQTKPPLIGGNSGQMSEYAWNGPQTTNPKQGKQSFVNPWMMNSHGGPTGNAPQQQTYTPTLPQGRGYPRSNMPGLSKEGINSTKRKLF